MGYDQLFAVGLLIHIVAGILMLVQMFRVKWWWGVLGIFLSPSVFVFLFKHWDMAKKPFLINLPGLVLIISSLALAPDKPIAYVKLNEGLPLVIKEDVGWKAMVNERDKPSHLFMKNELSGSFVHFHTYPASTFEEAGLSKDLKDISKSSFEGVKEFLTNISIEAELDRYVGLWKCYEIIFNGLLEKDNMKGSLIVINANEYLITIMFISFEDRYINNKKEFEGLLRSIRIDTPETKEDKTQGSTDTGIDSDLLEAAKKRNIATVKILLDKGANVNAKEKDGMTALMWAVERGHTATVQALLDKGANVNKKRIDGMTALMWAARDGHTTIAQALLDKGANVNAKEEKYGFTPLMEAAAEGHTAIAQALLEKGAEVNEKETKDGFTPLMWAAQRGHTATAQALLEKGAEVNEKEKDGKTPLMWAAERGHTTIVQALLDKGADVNAKNKDGMTPLMWAAIYDRTEIAKILLARGASVNDKEAKDGMAALMWAAVRGNTSTVQALLAEGANANTKTKDGMTALMVAVKDGHTATVKTLLDKGADVNAKRENGETALMWAAAGGHTEITELLKQYGAKE